MDENKTQSNDKDIKVLRTYTSDMADVIRDNEVSVIKIAMAEKEKREKETTYEEAKGTNFSKTLFMLGGVILIIAAIIGSSFLFQKKKELSQPIINTVSTFISYDSKSDIDVTDATNIGNLSNIIKQTKQVNPKTIEALFLTKKINDISGKLTLNDFLSILKTTIPGALERSLSGNYLLGRYSNPSALNENDKSAIFLILETTDYNQAYASMLDWEKTMLEDLFILFNINIPRSSDSLFGKPWKDIVISNKDARVFYGENGEGMLYYTFVNKNDFVITNSIEALKEVIERVIIKNAMPL